MERTSKILSPVSARSWTTSFNHLDIGSNGVSLSLKSIKPEASVVAFSDQTVWPDDRYLRKLLVYGYNPSIIVKKTDDPPDTGLQLNQVEFMAPRGIDGHIILSALGDTDLETYLGGYYAMVGRDDRLGMGCRLTIEKRLSADGDHNVLFGNVPLTFDPQHVYRIKMKASRTPGVSVHLQAWLDEYDPGSASWVQRGYIEHWDYNDVAERGEGGAENDLYKPILKGNSVYFGQLLQKEADHVYWDKFDVRW